MTLQSGVWLLIACCTLLSTSVHGTAAFPNATALVDAQFQTTAAVSTFVTDQGAAIEVVLANATELQFAFVGVNAAANFNAFQELSSAQLLSQYSIVSVQYTSLPSQTTTTAPTMAPSLGCASVKGSTTITIALQPDPGRLVTVARVASIQPLLITAINNVLGLSAAANRVVVLTAAPYDAQSWNGSSFVFNPVVIFTLTFTTTNSPTDVQPVDLVQSLATRWTDLQGQLSTFHPQSLTCLPATFQQSDPGAADKDLYRSQVLKFMGALIAMFIIIAVSLGAGWFWTQRLDALYQATPEFQAFSAYLNSGNPGDASLTSSFFKPSVFTSPKRDSSPLNLSAGATPNARGTASANANAAPSPNELSGVSPIVKTPSSMRGKRAVSFHQSTGQEL